jgi:hypothetical protein
MPTSAIETLYSTLVLTSPAVSVSIAATCALSLRKSRAINRQSHETSISAGASSASDSVVGTFTAPAASSTMKSLPLGVSVMLRPPGRECSTRSTTLTSEAGDATSGARPPDGPASKLYVTMPYGEHDRVRVPVKVIVLVVGCVAVWLLLLGVSEGDAVPERPLLSAPVELGICEADSVPVRLPLLLAVSDWLGVWKGEAVPVPRLLAVLEWMDVKLRLAVALGMSHTITARPPWPAPPSGVT